MGKKKVVLERLADESDEDYEARCAEAVKKPEPGKGKYRLLEVPRTNDNDPLEPHVIDSSNDLEEISAEFLRVAAMNPLPDKQRYVLMHEDEPIMAG